MMENMRLTVFASVASLFTVFNYLIAYYLIKSDRYTSTIFLDNFRRTRQARNDTLSSHDQPYNLSIRLVTSPASESADMLSLKSFKTTPNTVCDQILRSLSYSYDRTEIRSLFKLDEDVKRKVVIIGRGVPYGQTNNQLYTVVHAMDYAFDINATVAIIADSWAGTFLQELFVMQDNDHKKWVQDLEKTMGIHIVNNHSMETVFPTSQYQLLYKSAEEIFYYRTGISIEDIVRRRNAVYRYLWLHPARSSHTRDMCSVVNALLEPNETYAVIHSRWLNGHCLRCLAELNTVITEFLPHNQLDNSSACLLPPLYIKDILRQSGLSNKRIFVISDNQRPDIITALKADTELGPWVTTVPTNFSWVGGDMMLGVLAHVFIGNPFSTMSINIARARIAIGTDQSTNFLFAQMKKENDTSSWEFFCRDNCLYDKRIMQQHM